MALPVSFGLTAIGLGILSKFVPPDDVAPGKSLANLFTSKDQQSVYESAQDTQQTLSNMKQNEYNKIQTQLTEQIKNIQYNTSKQILNNTNKKETEAIKQNASLEIQKLKDNALRNATRAAAMIGDAERKIVSNAAKVVLAKPVNNNNGEPTQPSGFVLVNNTNRSKGNSPNYDVVVVNNNTNEVSPGSIKKTDSYDTYNVKSQKKDANVKLTNNTNSSGVAKGSSTNTSTLKGNTYTNSKTTNTSYNVTKGSNTKLNSTNSLDSSTNTNTTKGNTNGTNSSNVGKGSSTNTSTLKGNTYTNSKTTNTSYNVTKGSNTKLNSTNSLDSSTNTNTTKGNTNSSNVGKSSSTNTSTLKGNTNTTTDYVNVGKGVSTNANIRKGNTNLYDVERNSNDSIANTNAKDQNNKSINTYDITKQSKGSTVQVYTNAKDDKNSKGADNSENTYNIGTDAKHSSIFRNDQIFNNAGKTGENVNNDKGFDPTQMAKKAYDALEINSSNNISEEEMVQKAYQRAREIIQQAEQEVERRLQNANNNIKSLETDARTQASMIIRKAEENAANVLRKQSNSKLPNTNVVANVSRQLREQAEQEAKRIIETAQANAMKIRKDAQNTAQSNTNASAQKMAKARMMIQDAEAKAAKIMSNVNMTQSGLSKQFAELSRKEKELQQKLYEIQRLEENKIKETIQRAVKSVSQGDPNVTRNALRNASSTVNAAISETEQIRQNMRNQSKLLTETSQNTLRQQTHDQLQRIGNATIEQATASAQAKSILDKANLDAQRIIAEAKIQAGKSNKANANTAYDIIANANKKATEIQAKAQEESIKIIRSAQNVVKGLSNSTNQNCSLYSLNSKINPEMTPPSFNNELSEDYVNLLQKRVDMVLSKMQTNSKQLDSNGSLSLMFSDYNNTFIPSPDFNVDIFDDNNVLGYVQKALVTLHTGLTGITSNRTTNASVMGGIQYIIQLYIEIIRKLLTTPIMYKLTSLDADSIKSLIASTSIQLYDNKYKPINKTTFMEKLYKFLYIDVTPYLFIRQSPLLNPYYSTYTKQLEDHIVQDTENSAFVLYPKTGALDKRSMFVLRFVDMIANTYSKNDRDTKSFNYHVLTYIISILPDLYNFANNLHSHIENPENNAFAVSVNMLLFRKIRKNVLTYIKIRNDDGAVYNDRFKVFVDNNKNNTLLVRYNDHNIPYYAYDSTQKAWSASPAIKQDWDSVYGTPSFNEVFDVNNGILSVKGYSDEYLLGPFTQVFEQQMNNRNIADKMDEVVVALSKDNPSPQPVFLIGYGASGAGKTSSLVYFNKGIDIDSQNGILMHLCNRLSEGKGYPNIRVKSIEFYAKEGSGRPVQRVSPFAKDYLKFHYTQEKGFVLSESYDHKNAFKARVMQQLKGNDINKFGTTNFPQETVLGEVMIHMIDNDRFVKATTNNPNSSRSHCLIFINFGDEKSGQQFDPKRTLIVGDFAGVENLFNCMDDKQLKGFIGVKKDDGSGKPFYSEEDLSLAGQEGGRKGKKTNKKQKGGEGNSDFIDPCPRAIQETTDMFTLYSSPRTLRTQNDVIDKILDEVFETPDTYGAMLESIYNHVVKHAEVQSTNPFKTLLDTPSSKIEKYFNDYIVSNSETLQQQGELFVYLYKQLSTIDEKANPGETILEKLLDKIYLDVNKSTFSYNKDTKKNDIVQSGTESMSMYQMLKTSQKGLLISPKPPCIVKYESIPVDANTVYLTKNDDINMVLTSETCIKQYNLGGKYNTYKEVVPNAIQFANTFYNSLRNGMSINFDNDVTSYSLLRTTPLNVTSISPRKIFNQLALILNQPLFRIMNISVTNDKINFANIEKSLINPTMRKRLEPLIHAFTEGTISVLEFYKTMIKEAKSIVTNTACRVTHAVKVCGVRRAEGVFINNSLHGIREVIKEIMYEKNKNSINIAPLFHEPCLPSYCSKDNSDCFKLVKPKQSIANQIFEALIQELNPQLRGIAPEKIPKGETLKDLIVGVFCVLNLSRKANNPPPVPYINTNHIRFELSKSKQVNQKIINECRRLFDKLQFFLHKNSKVRIELNAGWLANINSIITNNEYVVKKGLNAEQENALYSLLNALDNISAASAMGTLQFVDMMSKYNTTDIICSQQKLNENGKLYNKLIEKLDLVDIVNKKDTYNVSNAQLKDHTIYVEPVTVVNTQKNVKPTNTTSRTTPSKSTPYKPMSSKKPIGRK